MKRLITVFAACLFALTNLAMAQYSTWLITDQTPTGCSSHNLRVSHVPTQSNEGICKTELYRRPIGGGTNSWVLVSTKTPTTNIYTDFSVSTVGEYMAYVFFGWITPSGPCSSGYSTSTNLFTLSTIYAPASANYKVDGSVVNGSTYLQTYACQALQMTNMALTGTGANPAWKVTITKVGSGLTATYGWNAGALPASYDMKTMMSTTWGVANLGGQYTVSLSVKNDCNPTGSVYNGLVQINANPTATSACFMISTNNSCSAFSAGGTTCATATNVCSLSPKISGSCSGGQWVGGYYKLVVEQWTNACTYVATIINTPNTPITSTSDVVCLDLNVLSGFHFATATGYRYKATWTIGNACGSSSTTRWFIDNIGGCKQSEEGVVEELPVDQPLGFSVFPIPARGELNVTWAAGEDDKTGVSLIDLTGRKLEVPVVRSAPGIAKLDVSKIAPGVYLVEVLGAKRQVKRVVIE